MYVFDHGWIRGEAAHPFLLSRSTKELLLHAYPIFDMWPLLDLSVNRRTRFFSSLEFPREF
jgi:hypothetical protein